MSRRKQFDEEHVIEAATRVFWTKGYAATSLSDLELAMGLNKSSIYNTFENKERLFGRCLEWFSEQYAQKALSTLDHPDFETGVRALCTVLGEGFECPDIPKGCLETSAALELGATDGDISRMIARGIERMLSRIEARCRQAVDDGQLDQTTDCEAYAALIVAINRGVVVLSMSTGSAKAGQKAYAMLFASLFPR